MLSIIAVIGKNRELGKDNALLYHVPGDLPRFKKLTTGHPVIMGRNTFESIGKPLPGRTNIVLTSTVIHTQKDVMYASTFDEAIQLAQKALGHEEIFIIGGGSVYAQAIGSADRLYLTVVDAASPADTFFPDYSMFTTVLKKEDHEANGLRFCYIILEP